MSCPCDQFEFPPRLFIPAGLSTVPRQLATFPEFRAALLRGIGEHPALHDWRGRQADDFGVMLLEMWAYVCDVTSFYDSVLAQENYLRTARQRGSVRKLIGLLGYVPRPAVAATVDLAAFADGRKAVALPGGTAFRSGAFDGNPPQVFELTADATVHPLSNEWKILPVRPATFGATATSLTTLLCEPGTVAVQEDDLVLVKVGESGYARTVSAVADQTGVDGAAYTAVTLSSAVSIPANTAVSTVKLRKPGSTAQLWTTSGSSMEFQAASGAILPYGVSLTLSGLEPSFRIGNDVIVSTGDNGFGAHVTKVTTVSVQVTAASTIDLSDTSGTVTSQVSVPAVNQRVTQITIEPLSFDFDWWDADASDFTIYHAFSRAGKVTIEGLTTLAPTDPLLVATPVEQPTDASVPSSFQFEDKNGDGAAVGASLVYPTGTFQLDQGTAWQSGGLVTPVRAFGNVITATRGETVSGEALGTGDATIPNQGFTLKKSPLTYVSAPTADNASGVASTLSVYVDGVLWTEVASFYGQAADARVYIVRQDDAAKSTVTFGDGVRACRLATGAVVTAYYRYGAGAAMPPAASITQIAKPVKGLRGIRNPIAAAGGADAEPADEMRKYGPRSALLLGRAVSLADLEAAAAAVAGVRATRADWRWNQDRLRPGAQIYYIGDSGLEPTILARLAALAEEGLPIDVEPATGLAKTLSIQVEIDPSYLEADVVPAVRAALMDADTGLLAPERIGIGQPLFRSRIYAFILGTPGAASVTSITLDGAELTDWGITPGAGNYFDFETGALLLNGT